jgi:carbamoyltransferase
MSTVWGVNVGTHDSSLASVVDGELVFAAHSERSSRKKNDRELHPTTVQQALDVGGEPNKIVFYERDTWKRARQIWAGQYRTAFSKPDVRMLIPIVNTMPIEEMLHSHIPSRSVAHHHSHAAAGYYTSPYRDAAVLVVDSIGEWETLTIWKGEGKHLKRVFSQGYPHSVGLWYSAMTQRIGLKPNEDEYILMGWAALGDPNKYKKRIYDDFFKPLKPGNASVRFRENLHRGCLTWAPELNTPQDYADIAASTQAVYEHVFKHLIKETKRLVKSDNLVVMGGCALNCVANSIAHREYNGNVWIMPNPGDAGSSLGAVLAYQQDFIEWTGPYQGYNIAGDYPVNSTLKQLQSTGLVGVANGKAEFGPRALGNRSLFADPRGTDVKDRVNTVKRRQEFRPFAPVILEADASDYFDGPVGPYMQYTSVCKQPELFPAIAHYDNTSRVQTVNQKEHPGLFKLLTEWKKRTGCPMLLNTSLNIKGEPMVDTEADAERWQEQYNVPVFTKEDKQ